DRLPGTFGLRSWRLGGFLEDNFKASKRLTLTLGLRYDLLPPYSEAHNRLANFDPASRAMQVAGSEVPRGLGDADFRDWSPGIGLRYRVTADQKTVPRAAYSVGRMDMLNNPSGTLSMAINPPFYYAQNITQNPFAAPSVF